MVTSLGEGDGQAGTVERVQDTGPVLGSRQGEEAAFRPGSQRGSKASQQANTASDSLRGLRQNTGSLYGQDTGNPLSLPGEFAGEDEPAAQHCAE